MEPAESFNYKEHPHKRKNLLTGEWILVSPHRAKRPWQGKVEAVTTDNRPKHDTSCYLCPGNDRAGGIKNPDYQETFVFENDFAALQPGFPEGEINKNDLLLAKSESGICKVICFSPRHDLTLPEMSVDNIVNIINTWKKEYSELSKNKNINYVQIFENKGELMGCSNPHPHGQIWSESSLPVEIEKETEQQHLYFQQNKTTLLEDYLKVELREKERVVYENNSFVILIPFWAVWPFETMILSKRAIQNITYLTEAEKKDFAECIKILTTKYDNMFNISFPYSAGIHQAPTDSREYPEWHLHMHFYPPLLRSATVKKYMVGYELLGNPQRDISPESAAERLRELSEVHYKSR